MGERKKIKVVYILGAGRSGSTMLSNILGQFEGFHNLGEPCYLWEQYLLEDGVCGCGSTVRTCSFWSDILSRAFRNFGQQEAQAMLACGQEITKTRHFPLLITPLGRHRLKVQSKDYVENLASLYETIQLSTGCKVIVDASKFPSYALILDNIEIIDLYTIHLVRDPRAVAYSWRRKKYDPGRAGLFGRMGQSKSSALWLSWNLGGEYMRKTKGPDRYLRVRYEDLIARPQQVIQDILSFVEYFMDISLPFLDSHQVLIQPTHSIGGNPVRFDQGVIKLQLDCEWMDRMKNSEKLLSTLITFPLMKRYEYGLI